MKEEIIPLLYLIGAILFFIGSCRQLRGSKDKIALWQYIIGSFLFIIGSLLKLI